jgi:flap endonuclease-1
MTQPMVEDAKYLLRLLGIPFVQAPSEAEAQCAYMTLKADVWGTSSKDYDSLLFGAPRLLRYLTISGREFLPSKGVSRPLKPELIELEKCLAHWNISREGLVDLAILVGTDFNDGLKGIGPKKALDLVQKHGRIENLSDEMKSKIEAQNLEEVRKFFLQPAVTDDYSLRYGDLQEDELYNFLCVERAFSAERVATVIQRMKGFYAVKKQAELKKWLKHD